MATMLSTQVLREVSQDRHRIIDAGCGSGFLACYIAKHRPGCDIQGYDISADEIRKAEARKDRYGVEGVTFCVASHDTYVPNHGADLLYTAGSLLGDDEQTGNFNATLSIVQRRLSRFQRMLNTNGIYVISWKACRNSEQDFVDTAEELGLKHIETRRGRTQHEFYYKLDGMRMSFHLDIPWTELCMIFEKNGA